MFMAGAPKTYFSSFSDFEELHVQGWFCPSPWQIRICSVVHFSGASFKNSGFWQQQLFS